ncbi:MAG TPA: hypothetical protein VK636_23000 [Gemmatimonadaceae bacterium]|nr:hypothetical protein [Gemmatimonadaceae bacterium]
MLIVFAPPRSYRALVHVFAFISTSMNAALALPQKPVDSLRPTSAARVLGVYDPETGEAIEGADVVDINSKLSARTTKTGTVGLGFLQGEAALLRITKVGYKPNVTFVKLGPLDTVPLTVLLSRAVVRLPTVITHDSAGRYISPGLQSFEERRGTSVGGQFLSEVELRKADNRKLSDVLRRFNGMTIQCHPPLCEVVTTRQLKRLAFLGGVCYSDIYLNGALVSEGSNPSESVHNIDEFAVRDLAGIEFYAGAASVPPEFNKTGSPCGVILLWSRER